MQLEGTVERQPQSIFLTTVSRHQSQEKMEGHPYLDLVRPASTGEVDGTP